ncbi:hypothetical protein QN357_01820 [Cryobacterium sp. RTC2.1]|uniref:hypothetical protein n=1 Tax=Cryobacterium sp. RTC2.1 TaxID=3048634 RepID=UPI002B22CAAF|nr:hypothetical protein [Cryobacterium sp. RTC2.1]MEB0001675.1 hypothetical protein [Cryobacterium sp. RTC2.1]
MDLFVAMSDYRREASWAVWELDASGALTGTASFPNDQARATMHGRAMVVSLNPGTDRVRETAATTPDWANFHNPARKHNDIFLAEAFVGTPLWGSYMTDLHPAIAESDSRLVRSKPDEILLAVRSLIRQAEILGAVESIVCVGGKTYQSVARHAALIEQELGLTTDSVKRMPHYSRANAKIHRHDPEAYRSLVHASLGLV